MNRIEPTVGRSIHMYNASADNPLEPRAGIIAAVNDDGTINVALICGAGCTHPLQNVRLIQDGDQEANGYDWYATWMPYQLGQAAKTEEVIASHAGGPVGATSVSDTMAGNGCSPAVEGTSASAEHLSGVKRAIDGLWELINATAPHLLPIDGGKEYTQADIIQARDAGFNDGKAAGLCQRNRLIDDAFKRGRQVTELEINAIKAESYRKGHFAGCAVGRRQVNKESGDKAFQSGIKQGRRMAEGEAADRVVRAARGKVGGIDRLAVPFWNSTPDFQVQPIGSEVYFLGPNGIRVVKEPQNHHRIIHLPPTFMASQVELSIKGEAVSVVIRDGNGAPQLSHHFCL